MNRPPFTIHRTDIHRRARMGTSLAISLVWLALLTAVGLIVWALWGAL